MIHESGRFGKLSAPRGPAIREVLSLARVRRCETFNTRARHGSRRSPPSPARLCAAGRFALHYSHRAENRARRSQSWATSPHHRARGYEHRAGVPQAWARRPRSGEGHAPSLVRSCPDLGNLPPLLGKWRPVSGTLCMMLGGPAPAFLGYSPSEATRRVAVRASTR